MIEAGEVRAATQIPHRQRGRVAVLGLEPDVVDRARSDRVRHDVCRRAQEWLERRRAAAAEVRSREGPVFVDVRHDTRAQRILELFDPLGGADEPPLFRVPRREHHGPRWFQAIARECRERARGLEHAHRAADVVAGAGSPGVAMAAHDDPLIGPALAADHPDRVPDLVKSPRAAFGLYVEPRTRRSGPHVIVERQRALPALWHRRPGHGLQKAPRIPVAHRDDGDLGDIE